MRRRGVRLCSCSLAARASGAHLAGSAAIGAPAAAGADVLARTGGLLRLAHLERHREVEHADLRGSVTISSDTSGTPVSCTASDGNGSVTTTVNVRRDASPPSVSAAPDRGPDANGWYNHGVTVRFSGSDGISGISSCSSDSSYSGPDKADASVSGTCTNGAGLTGSYVVLAQVRRDRSRRRGEGGAQAGRERVVQPRGRGRLRRLRRACRASTRAPRPSSTRGPTPRRRR